VLRDEFPSLPRSIRALEGGLTKVRDWLGRRTRRLQNVHRINVMLGLMRAGLAQAGSASRYSRIIRDELARTNGRPKLDWRRFHYKGQVVGGSNSNPVGSLFRLAEDARDEAEHQRPSYWVSKQASSMHRKLAEMNHIHFTLGAPLLELTRARVPSVSLKRLHVSDFPTYLEEWDPANARDPYRTGAGHGSPVDWICTVDPTHRWSASPDARLGRLQGCPNCKKRRGVAELMAGASDPNVMRAAIDTIRAELGPFDDPAAATGSAAPSPAVAPSTTTAVVFPPIRRTPSFVQARYPVVIVDDGPDEIPFEIPAAVGPDPDGFDM